MFGESQVRLAQNELLGQVQLCPSLRMHVLQGCVHVLLAVTIGEHQHGLGASETALADCESSH